MKKNLFKLTVILSIVVILLLFLFYATPLPNQNNNGFKRSWLNYAVKYNRLLDSKLPVTNLSGITNHHLYISLQTPQVIFETDLELKITDTFIFPIKITEDILSANRLAVDSPWIYCYANNLPGYISGKLNKTNTINEISIFKPSMLFTKAVSITPSKLVVRTFDSAQQNQVFQVLDTKKHKIQTERQIIDNQSNYGITTDGGLLYDTTTKSIIYVQYYQNRFFSLDTNLAINYTAKTIDTTNTNTAEIAKIFLQGEDRLMPKKARITPNKSAAVDNGYLYIVSGIRADNETNSSFNDNSVIDVYEIKNGHYKGSFYIPNKFGGKVKSIIINKNLIVALYKENICTFDLNK